jgi:hypothetical protein
MEDRPIECGLDYAADDATSNETWNGAQAWNGDGANRGPDRSAVAASSRGADGSGTEPGT